METLGEPAGGRRVRRGRPPSLTVEQIAETALRLTDLMQFDQLSMRQLAAELGVPVMTLYGYVPNKRALFDLIADHVLRPVSVPAGDGNAWEERMWTLQRATRDAVGRHVGLQSGHTIGQSSEAARLADGVMAILADGGFDREEAELAFATLFTFMLGQIELDAILRSTGADDEPVTIAPSLDRDEAFEFGFDAIVAGLKARRTSLSPRRRR
jgi:AcrR family transcriptional regulator